MLQFAIIIAFDSPFQDNGYCKQIMATAMFWLHKFRTGLKLEDANTRPQQFQTTVDQIFDPFERAWKFIIIKDIQ